MESTQPILRCRYGYDPLDRLISQLQPDAPAHQRFYCKSRLATEIQGAIGFSVFQNNDLLLAQRKNQGGAVESTLLATDLQRSVLHTLTADQQQHPIAYSPYGHRQAESGLTSLLGFNGERPDPVTGYYLLGNGYRAFNPVLMRFNSPDSWSPFGEGGLNPYAYCLNDPANRKDETGHMPTAIVNKFLAWASRVKDRVSISFARSLGSKKSGDIQGIPTEFSSGRTSISLPKQTSHSRPQQPPSLPSPGKAVITLHQPKLLSELSSLAIGGFEVKPEVIPMSLAQGILKGSAVPQPGLELKLAHQLKAQRAEVSAGHPDHVSDLNANIRTHLKSLRPISGNAKQRP
jgi:RHS repeat-associated protein